MSLEQKDIVPRCPKCGLPNMKAVTVEAFTNAVRDAEQKAYKKVFRWVLSHPEHKDMIEKREIVNNFNEVFLEGLKE